MKHKVIVVGAGLGGLSTAIRLQAQGWDVEIFEKNDRPGGRMNQIQEKGFKIDMGPTLVMMPEMLQEVFQVAGKRMEDYLELVSLSPSYEVHLGDGTRFNMTSNLHDLMDQIEERRPGDAKRFFRYFEQTHQKYRLSRKYFIERSFNKITDLINPSTLLGLFGAKPYGTVTSFTKKYIKDPFLRAAFTFQTLYLGVSPHTCPSVYSLLAYIELAEGVWFPKGGIFEIAKGLEKLFFDLGGKIHYNHPVDAFEYQGKKIVSVESQGKRYETDAVVCNQDTGAALKELVPEKLRPSAPTKKIDKLDYGCSCFMVYLGVNRKYDHMYHHTVVLPKEFDGVLEDLFDKGVPPQEPAYYICRPTATDPSLAPKGQDVIYMLFPVPHTQQYDQWSEEEVEKYKNHLLAQVEERYLPDLRKHIVVEKVFTPRDFKSEYGILHGSAFGLSPSFFQSAYFRPRNASPDIENLFFTGASSHPGGGIPVVLLSGRLTANEITSRFSKPKKREAVIPSLESDPEPTLVVSE